MADIVVTNQTATPIGLWDADSVHHVVGAMGIHETLLDPSMSSQAVINALRASGAVTVVTPAAPANETQPEVSGDAVVGETLICDPGEWSGAPTPALSYQWQMDDGGWDDLDGETGALLVLTEDHEGNEVRCVVTATNDLGTDSAESGSVGPVAATP